MKTKSYRSVFVTTVTYIMLALFTQGYTNCGLFNAQSNGEEGGSIAESLAAGAGVVDMLKVSAPVFEPTEGIVAAGTEVDIFCETEGAAIYYRFLEEPGQQSDAEMILYDPQNKPKIQATGVIEAIAVRTDMADSDAVTVIYTVE